MHWMDAALLGLVGAVASELLLQSALLTTVKRWPWRSRRQRLPFLVGIGLKLIGSAIFTGGLAATGWMSAAAGVYVVVGAIAPALQQRVAAVAAVALFGSASPQLPEGEDSADV